MAKRVGHSLSGCPVPIFGLFLHCCKFFYKNLYTDDQYLLAVKFHFAVTRKIAATIINKGDNIIIAIMLNNNLVIFGSYTSCYLNIFQFLCDQILGSSH